MSSPIPLKARHDAPRSTGRLDHDEVCRLYEEGSLGVTQLLAASGLQNAQFYALLRKRGLPLRRPRRSSRTPDPDKPATKAVQPVRPLARNPVRREDLIARLWEAAAGHMAQIETRLARLDQEHMAPAAAGTEGELRLMGLIVKTLRDLAALDADVAGARKKEMAHDDLAAELASCPETMREELARRLAGLRESR